jgi:succinate dehydrogenase/fumarate reductase flavoprotein subunit
MQGLADGYFVIPYTIGNYLATQMNKKISVDRPEFAAAQTEVQQRIQQLLSIKGKRTVTSFHRELGLLVWERCGMIRSEASLKEALQKIPVLREEFWQNAPERIQLALRQNGYWKTKCFVMEVERSPHVSIIEMPEETHTQAQAKDDVSA